jgi:hypothetical protein
MIERFISNGWTVKAYDLSGNLVFESKSLERSLALQVYWDLHDCVKFPYSRIERVAFDGYGEKYSYNITPPKMESVQ